MSKKVTLNSTFIPSASNTYIITPAKMFSPTGTFFQVTAGEIIRSPTFLSRLHPLCLLGSKSVSSKS